MKQRVAIDRFLQSVLVDTRLTPESMLIGDKNALIVAARCSGYGHDYLASMTCPNCGTNSKQEVDLNEARELYHGYVESEAEEEEVATRC